MNQLCEALLALILLVAFAAAVGRPWIDNPTLIAWHDGDLHPEDEDGDL